MKNKLMFFLAAVASLYCIGLSANESIDSVPKLIVTGEAVLHKPADQAILHASIVTTAEDAKTALEQNSTKVQTVIDAINNLRYSKLEYQTHDFSIDPQYAPRPQKNDDPKWKPEIVGYHVINSLTVKSTQIDNVGTIIDAMTSAGANQINSIVFNLADSRIHRSEAITAATENALQDANELAKALNVKLGRVLMTTLDNANITPINLRAQPMMLMKSGSANYTTPIEAGDVDVRANVTVVFQIFK